MPRGILVVAILNLALIAVFGGNLYVFYADGVTRTYTFVASWIALAGLTVSLTGLLLRGRLWHWLARAGLYTVALAFGLQVMAFVPRLLEPGVGWNAAGMALVIFYLVGARGYLGSPVARRYFGLGEEASKQA